MGGENVPKITKKFLKLVRVMYYMLRKGISKGKLLADLNIMMNKAKFASKLESIHNLMFHHHVTDNEQLSHSVPLNEYEFNCSNSQAYHKNHKKSKKQSYDDVLMEMINSVAASPALPGFGSTPLVRQLRITDSPFPLRDGDEDINNHVDEAAEEFIMKFYNDLKRQNGMAY